MTTYNDDHDFLSPEDQEAFAAMADDLAWSEVRQPILAGIAARKKQKRRLLWFFVGAGMILLAGSYAALRANLSRPTIASFLVQTIGLSEQSSSPVHQSALLNSQERTAYLDVAPKDEKQQEVTTQLAHSIGPARTLSPSLLSLNNQLEESSLATAIDRVAVNDNEREAATVLVPVTAVSTIAVDKLPILPISPLAHEIDDATFNITANESESPVSKQEHLWRLGLWTDANLHQTSYRPSRSDQPPAEKPLNVLQGELRLSRKLGPQFTIATGLRYQVWQGQAEANGEYETRLYRPNTIDTIFTNVVSGDVTYSYTDSIPGLIQRDFKHTNRQYSLQLPILLGYGHEYRRWEWNVQMGVQVELSHRATGRKLLNETADLQIVSSADWYASSRIARSALLEAANGYKL